MTSGQPSAPPLPHTIILELHGAAMRTGLGGSRAELLAGLGPELINSLPVAETPAGQLLLDLEQLNRTGLATGGSPPLVIWLKNALALRGHLVDRKLFDAVLAMMSGEPVVPAVAASVPGTLRDVLRELRVVLSDLYPNRSSAVRLAGDAGLQTSRIDLEGSAESLWHNVLEEARKQGLVGAIVSVARDEYPYNKALVALSQRHAQLS